MSPESFKYFLNMACQKIYKQYTKLRKAIALDDQLCLTIIKILDFRFKVGKNRGLALT